MSAGGEELEPADFRALAELRYQLRRFLHFSERAARAAGIEPQQHQALLAVKGLPEGQEATIGVLAERLQVRHHSVVGLVDRLEAHGLVRRDGSDKDARKVLVRLTAAGEHLLHDLSRHHRAELRAAGPHLTRALERITQRERGSGESTEKESA